jgi:hypothetical protein
MANTEWEVLPAEDAARPSASGGWSSRSRLGFAMAIAVASDLASVWLEFVPPMQWTLDIATAGLLFLTLGRQWAILPALVAEAIPGIAMFPAWVLVVIAVATTGTVGTATGKTEKNSGRG